MRIFHSVVQVRVHTIFLTSMDDAVAGFIFMFHCNNLFEGDRIPYINSLSIMINANFVW